MHLPIGIFHQSSDSMKLRLVLILLLFAASVGILVWLYCAATRRFPGRRRSRRGPRRSRTSTPAAAANTSNRSNTTSSPRSPSGNPARMPSGCSGPWLSPNGCRSTTARRPSCTWAAATRLRSGSSSSEARPTATWSGVSSTNSGASASGTVRRSTARCGKTTAMRRGLLARQQPADRRNAALLEHCRRSGKDHPDSCRFLVCPGCGNIYAAGDPDPYCPFCLTRSERFVRFE